MGFLSASKHFTCSPRPFFVIAWQVQLQEETLEEDKAGPVSLRPVTPLASPELRAEPPPPTPQSLEEKSWHFGTAVSLYINWVYDDTINRLFKTPEHYALCPSLFDAAVCNKHEVPNHKIVCHGFIFRNINTHLLQVVWACESLHLRTNSVSCILHMNSKTHLIVRCLQTHQLCRSVWKFMSRIWMYSLVEAWFLG